MKTRQEIIAAQQFAARRRLYRIEEAADNLLTFLTSELRFGPVKGEWLGPHMDKLREALKK